MFSLGQRIREIRIKKGISQTDLAKGLCTPSMISQIESDRARPSYKILSTLSEKLAVQLEQLLSEVDLNLDAISGWKIAQAVMASGGYALAIPMFRELLEKGYPSIPNVDIQLSLTECFIQTGQLTEAEHGLQELHEIAKIRMDKLLLAKVLYAQGRISNHRKQPLIAIFEWREALDIIEETPIPDVYLKAELLFQMAQTYSKLGYVQQAVDSCTEAALLYEEADDLFEQGQAYLELSKSCQALRDLERSVQYAEQARGIFLGLEQQVLVLQLQMNQAVLLAETGQEVEALARLEQVQGQFLSLGKSEEAGLCYVELAKVYLRLNQLQEAGSTCDQARHLLPATHPAQAAIHRLRGQIAKKQGQREQAIHHFQQAADLYIRMGEVGEWEDTQSEAARIYAEDQDFAQAYSIMHEVRQSIRQELFARGILL